MPAKKQSDLFKEAQAHLDQAEAKFQQELKHYEAQQYVPYTIKSNVKDGWIEMTVSSSNTTAPPIPESPPQNPSEKWMTLQEIEQLDKYKSMLKTTSDGFLVGASVYEPQEVKMIDEETGEELEDEPEQEATTKAAYRDRYATRAQALRKYVHGLVDHGIAPNPVMWQKIVRMVDALPTSPVLPKSRAEDQVRAIRSILKVNGIDNSWVPSKTGYNVTELRVLEGIRLILSGQISKLDQHKYTEDEVGPY